MRAALAILAIAILAGGGWYLFGQSGKNAASGGGTLPNSVVIEAPASKKIETPAKLAEKPATSSTTGGFGTLRGVVKYAGPQPAITMIPLPAAVQAQCGHNQVLDESLLVDPNSGGLKWTIIRILDVKPAEELKKLDKPLELSQKGCTFTPHVIVTPPGNDLIVLNPDGMMHNIHTTPYDFLNTQQNLTQGPGEKFKLYKASNLSQPEIIEIRCDIHAWMKGFIVVHDPRYCGVSAADGSFEIKNIPAGTYKVHVWHEKFGNLGGKETHSIDIKAGETKTWDMSFGPKK